MLCKTGQEGNRITVFAQGILWHNTWVFCLRCGLLEGRICIVMQPQETVTLTFFAAVHICTHQDTQSSWLITIWFLYSPLIYYPKHCPQKLFLTFSQFQLLNHGVDYRSKLAFPTRNAICSQNHLPFYLQLLLDCLHDTSLHTPHMFTLIPHFFLKRSKSST